MIRIGIIGCNYGRLVHLPAFRLDSRCEVIALAGTDAARAAELARATSVPLSFGNWTDLVEHPDVDAITIAAPPALQPAIALRALELNKPVFAEKPMAIDLAAAAAMARAAEDSGRTTMVDINFSAILSWRKARTLLEVGGLTLDLRGTDDAHLGLDDYAAVSGRPDRTAALAIGVTHAPYRRILDAMTADKVKMIFAGHTHGGQVCVPLHGALTANCDLPLKQASGLSKWKAHGRTSWLHVSAGLGSSPLAPYRFACPPEATLVSLTPRSAG